MEPPEERVYFIAILAKPHAAAPLLALVPERIGILALGRRILRHSAAQQSAAQAHAVLHRRVVRLRYAQLLLQCGQCIRHAHK
ncbi:MAG: hypothetical protein IPG74_04410 [Flavobacteriales bacterium]|nr:hypothetical protein [Flavobacteriales bacterium]